MNGEMFEKWKLNKYNINPITGASDDLKTTIDDFKITRDGL